MIQVTEKAKKELKRLLTTSCDWPGARLRLLDRGQGKLGLGIDIETSGDQVVEYEGMKLLLIEPDIITHFKDISLDIEETTTGIELVIDENS